MVWAEGRTSLEILFWRSPNNPDCPDAEGWRTVWIFWAPEGKNFQIRPNLGWKNDILTCHIAFPDYSRITRSSLRILLCGISSWVCGMMEYAMCQVRMIRQIYKAYLCQRLQHPYLISLMWLNTLEASGGASNFRKPNDRHQFTRLPITLKRDCQQG